MKPVKMGRLWRGTVKAMMINAPAKMPAEPTPAIARPTIRALDVGAAPQIADPSSKRKMAIR